MIATISGANNHASIRFHSKMGFSQSGVLKKIGYKFGKPIDVIIMQRFLEINDTEQH